MVYFDRLYTFVAPNKYNTYKTNFALCRWRLWKHPQTLLYALGHRNKGLFIIPKNYNIMTNEKLNLRPLYELLAIEVDLDQLIEHLHNIHYYFSQNSMKVSCSDGEPVDEQEIICQYWIERLKQMFEDLKK